MRLRRRPGTGRAAAAGAAAGGALILVVLAAGNALGADDAPEPRWWGREANRATVPFPFIAEPVGSWVYDEIERQIALGNLTRLPYHTRPLPRSLIAARVAEAMAAGRHSIGLERLARELAWEARMMGLDFAHAESRPWITLGPPDAVTKFNGLVNLGGSFEDHERPEIGQRGSFGFRGMFWHPSGFGMVGEYLVMDTPGAAVFGDPIFTGGEVQFNTPRYGMSWHGSVFHVWAARENLQWGPGRGGGLLAGGGTDNVAQVGYQVYLGDFVTATAAHGWLSQAEHRFLALHRVEMNLGRFRLGIGEAVRYDAAAPELLYLLNLVPYSAVERLLTAEGSAGADRDSLFRSNWMFSVDLYWRMHPGWAAYGEILVDDIQRDQGLFDTTVEGGTPWRTGYQVGAVRVVEGRRRLTLQTEFTRVNNYTYAVFYGRDFFHRGKPLGYPRGADVADLDLWADLDLDLDWTLTANAFRRWTGEGNNAGPWCSEDLDGNNPYGTDCQTYGDAAGGRFAGTVERRLGLTLGAAYAPRDNLRLRLAAGAVRVENADHEPGRNETRPLVDAQASWRW